MIKKIFNKKDLDNILTDLRYYENFQNNFLERPYKKLTLEKELEQKNLNLYLTQLTNILIQIKYQKKILKNGIRF